MYTPAKYVIWKVVIVWAVFAALHYANDAFPNPLLAFIGEAEGRRAFGDIRR